MWLVCLAMQMPPASPPLWWGGRVWSSPVLNVGVRPAVFVSAVEQAIGVTVQLRLPLP
jgi:hypothetical protein